MRFGQARDGAPGLHPPEPWHARVKWSLLAGVGAAVALLFVLRQPLSDWLWPDTRAQQLQADAAAALAQGRLSATDGRGARELYEAALALDPDRSEARDGLVRVGEAALAQAERAIATGRFGQARDLLKLASDLSVPRARADALAKRLRDQEAAASGIDGLLEQAQAAFQTGRFDGGDDSALPIYQRVLALQPNQTQALEGREDTLAELLQQARASLTRGDLDEAAARVRRVQEADPGHVDLPDALAALTRASESHRRASDDDLRRGRLAAAADGYREVLAAQPDDGDARRGLVRVAQAYAARSERYAADFRFEDARRALRDAQAAAAEAPGIAEAKQRLARAQQLEQRLGGQEPSAQRQRRVRLLLAEAAQAESRGDLLTPPGDSAYDKLRAAQALAPQDAKVRAAMARLLPAAKQCFERELRDNRLRRARECLDVRSALEGEGPALHESRRRLAQRWIAIGDERLGAGELPAAQAALTAARELDPDAAGLDEFSARLRAAAPVRN